MAFEYLFLIIGVIIGALIVYALLSQKVLRIADEKAEQIASRLFGVQKDQLEQSFNQTYMAKLEEWKTKILHERIIAERADALDRSRSVLKGKIGEQLAPLLPEFLKLCNPSDARFIGSPIDYLIFRNMTCDEGQELPIEVVLLDIKTGSVAALSKVQKRIQEAIEAGRVRFYTLRLGKTI